MSGPSNMQAMRRCTSVIELLLPLLPLHPELPPGPAGLLLAAGCNLVAACAVLDNGGTFSAATPLNPTVLSVLQVATAQVRQLNQRPGIVGVIIVPGLAPDDNSKTR